MAGGGGGDGGWGSFGGSSLGLRPLGMPLRFVVSDTTFLVGDGIGAYASYQF